MSSRLHSKRVTTKPGGTQVLIALIVVQIALVVPSSARWLHDRGTPRGDLVRLDTGVPAGVALTIETGAEGALAYARQWATDAYLFGAAMQIDWPTKQTAAASSEIPDSGWIIYTFGTSRDETMSILVDRRSGAVFDEQHMTWTSQPARRISNTTYPISSTTALFATEAIVGATYRQACPTYRHLSRVSLVPSDVLAGEVGTGEQRGYWLVSYEDSRSLGRPAFTVRVDAQKGDVNREDVFLDGTSTCKL